MLTRSIDQPVPVAVAPHDRLAGLDIPAALQASVERHRDNLLNLVRTLRVAGFGDEQIESGVSAIVASYRSELMTAITSLRAGTAQDTSLCERILKQTPLPQLSLQEPRSCI